MIDKSIRQYYQEGNKVNVIKKGIDTFTSKAFPTTDQGKLDVAQLAKNVATNQLTTAATKKLAGTGILSSLGPIGAIIAYMLAKRGMKYASGKIKPDIKTALQSFQAGMIGSPKEQKELNKLEKRRANILQRKEEGKSYSDKNLGIVTRAIAEAKGIDINNPNEMKNIDKDISNLYNKTIYAAPSVDSEENQPYNEDIITRPTVEDTAAMEDIITRPTVIDTAAMEDIITRPTVIDTAANEDIINKITIPIYSNPNEDRAREEKEAFDRAVAENAAKAAAEAAAQRAYSARVPDRIYGGGNGGGGGGGGGQAAADARGGSSYSSPFAKGGRVDKALGGRSRDI